MKIPNEKISNFEKLGYASGDFASNLFWQTFMYFLPIFYTDVFGLPLAAAAWLFGLSRILDAVTDPTVGIIADRTKTRWGRFRPYVFFGAIPFGIIGVLSFTTPDLSVTGKVVYAFITYNLMMILYTVVNIPYSSLMGVITPNSQERTKISSLRFILAFSAGLFVTAFNNSFVDNFGEMGTSQVISKIDLLQQSGQDSLYNAYEAGGKVGIVDKSIIIEQARIKKINDFGITVIVGDYLGKKEKDIILDTIPTIHIADIVSFSEKQDFSKAEEIVANSTKYIVVDVYNSDSIYYDGKLKSKNVLTIVDKTKLAGFEKGKGITVISQSKGYRSTVILYAILAVILFFFTFVSTKERVIPKKAENNNIKEDLKDLIKNKPWLLLLGAGIFTMFYVSIRNGAIMYYFKYYISVDEIFGFDLVSAFMVVGTLASIVGTGAVTTVARYLGKKQTYITLMLLSTFFTAAFYWIGHDQVILLFVLFILANLFMGPTSALVWAMYADVADFSEYKTGRRATGLIFSASTMAQKIGWAIGGVITMVILGFVGYDQNAVTQTPTAITGIKALISLVPAAVSVLCAILVYFYALDDKTMEKVQVELAAKPNEE